MRAILVFFFISLFSLTSYAKTINLYEQPKADSKVVGTLDSSAGIIPIFTPKDTGWIKVGDPRNGNVGWIRASDLRSVGFSYQVLRSSDGKQNYQVIQYGNSPAPEVQKNWQQMQLRQQAIQRDMQKMMQDMYKDMPAMWTSFPMVVPVVIVPEKSVPSLQKPAQPAKIN